MGVVHFRLATLVRTAEPGAGAKTRLTKKENDFSILFRVARPRGSAMGVVKRKYGSPPNPKLYLTYLQFPGWLLSPRQPYGSFPHPA
jgi:hypothetical protein